MHSTAKHLNHHYLCYFPSTLQSISSYPMSCSASFAREKHLLPKKGELVLVAPRGLGWDVQIILWREEEVIAVSAFNVAGFPQSKKMTPFFLFSCSDCILLSTALIISSVNSSQPYFLCELGSPFTTTTKVYRPLKIFVTSKAIWVA